EQATALSLQKITERCYRYCPPICILSVVADNTDSKSGDLIRRIITFTLTYISVNVGRKKWSIVVDGPKTEIRVKRGVRHEVVRVAVRPIGPHLGFCPQCPTRTC